MLWPELDAPACLGKAYTSERIVLDQVQFCSFFSSVLDSFSPCLADILIFVFCFLSFAETEVSHKNYLSSWRRLLFWPFFIAFSVTSLYLIMDCVSACHSEEEVGSDGERLVWGFTLVVTLIRFVVAIACCCCLRLLLWTVSLVLLLLCMWAGICCHVHG